MRQAIENVPSDGRFVILEDDSSGSYAVARWSAEAGDWIGEKGQPIKIAPTHWHPMPDDKYHPQEDNESGPLSPLAPAPSPVKSKRAPPARRRLVALSLATVVVAALVATSFRTDVVAYLKQYAGQHDVVRTGTPDVPVTSQAAQAAESATAAYTAPDDDAARIRQAVESTTAELRRSLQQERGKAQALTQSLATAQREIDKHTALANKAGDDAAQIKRAAENTTAELRQSLQQERGKAEALTQSLATAQREIDKHAALANKAGDDAAQIKRAAEIATAELRQTLQRERDSSEAMAKDLATAQREIDKHTELANMAADDAAKINRAAESAAMELQQSMRQERERAEALAQDLAIARRETDTRTALASKAGDDAAQIKRAAESTTAELRQSLQQERDRAEALAQDLATARREIDTHTALTGKAGEDAAQIKRAAETAAAELRQSLQQERDRAEALAKDLARARRDIEMFAALTGRADDDATKVKQAMESTTAEFRQSLQQERDKAEASAQTLAAAHLEIDKYAALARKADDDAAQMKRAAESAAAELRQSLQQERDKAEAQAQTLARARREIDMLAALAGKASDDATAQIKAAERTTAELRQSLQHERERAAAVARDLESTRRLTAPRNAPEPTTVAQVTQVVEAAAVQQPATEPQDGPAVARLLVRAGTLLNNGDIGAARIVLEHATATGSARASFALAETYDPLVLSTWGTYGTRGDPTRARELYTKAHAGGIKNAQERLNALQQ